MAWKDRRNLQDARREMVAQLRLRGLTEREIVAALDAKGLRNPETGKPYSTGCIAKDIIALRKQWQANAARDTGEHKSEQLAQTREVIRAAWAKGKLDTVLRALEREAKLLGTDAPTKNEHSGLGGQEIVFRVIYGDDGTTDPTA